MKCTVCNGTGVYENPKQRFKNIQKEIERLRKEGFTFREVTKALNYTSTNAIRYYLNKKI